jgi:hypothetical protein
MNPSDMDALAGARFPKARKPYMITKQREKWTEEEHKLFLEAMQLHGRAWRRIQGLFPLLLLPKKLRLMISE